MELVVNLFGYLDYSVLIHPKNVEKQYHLPSFGLSVEIWSGFSRLVCSNWVDNKIFTSLNLEKKSLKMPF